MGLRGVIGIACLALIAGGLWGQDKPTISKITVLPSEPVVASGNCKSSTAGYVEIKGRRILTEAEIGKAVAEYLKDGYIVTIYPATMHGTFVDLECTNTMTSAAP
jgi:hypothetical protein